MMKKVCVRVAGDSDVVLDAGRVGCGAVPGCDAEPRPQRRPRPRRRPARPNRSTRIPARSPLPATWTSSPGRPTSSAASSRKSNPKLTLWPAGDIGIALYSGESALKSASINFGVWNSLHTGSSGLDNPTAKKQHYEEDFYAALGLGFSKAAFTTTYTAYTSPNGMFGTVQEIAFKTAVVHKISPYVLLAQELGAVGADGGANKGTYVELGIGPSWPVAGGKATIGDPGQGGLERATTTTS